MKKVNVLWVTRLKLLSVYLILSLLLACGGGDSDTNDGGSLTATLDSIAVTPAALSIRSGNELQFTATGTYSDSSTLNITSQVDWDSSEKLVATIDTSGYATTLAEGTTTISAAIGGISGSVTLAAVSEEESTAVLVSINLIPSSPSITVGGSQRFTARGVYSDSSTRNITDEIEAWTSSHESVATIDDSGFVTTLTEGTTTITASLGNTSATATLIASSLSTTGRAPIVIYYDEDFTAANGVVSGSGTESDPYIIEGWSIDASQGDTGSWPYIRAGIAVYQTTKYFIIKNCQIVTSGESECGILLSYLDNGTVQNCVINGGYTGISLSSSYNVVISSNTIEDCEDGISNGSSSSDSITISDNTITGCTDTGIEFHYLTNSSATGNIITNNGSGIYASALWFGDCTISNNIVQGNEYNGIELDDDSEDNTISYNNTSNNGGDGLAIYGTGNTISYNTSNGNTWTGILLDYTGLTTSTASSNTVSNNTSSGNGGDGIYVGSGCINNIITNNIALGNNTSGWWYYDININASPNTVSGNTYGTYYP